MIPSHRWTALLAALLIPAAVRAADADKYLLDDTDAVLAVEVRQLFDSPLFKKNYQAPLQKALRGDTIITMVNSFGIDPFKDVERVLVVHGESSHRVVNKAGEGSLFIIVRGRFDPAKAHARATQFIKEQPKLLRSSKEPNGIIYEVALQRPLYVALVERTALVISPFKDQVSDALDKAAGKKTTQLKHKDVEGLIEKADAKQALWLLATGRMAYAIENGKRQTLAAAGVDEATGGITVTAGVKSSFLVATRDAAAAKKVAASLQMDLNDILERLVNSGLDAKKLGPLREIFRTLEISTDGKNVTLQGDVEAKVFEDALK